ncbi:MAG: SDR family NAD(P)-dependent oxidoreductase [Saprospiraceae bacterium]|nr:SDR family NAD(P)-dependent oxidoreductase [Saprospiraceae bacterium]
MTKTILISGASSGIGLAIANKLAQCHHNLILCGRRAELLKKHADNLRLNSTSKIHELNFDIRNYNECEKAIHSLPDDFTNIDVLINNAGLALGLDFIQDGKLEDWETMIDTNIKGLLYITRIISQKMIANKNGHIINIGSTAGKETYPKGNVYCATKFAVDALSKSIRQDLYLHNIRVSQVCPGHVEETEFAINRFDGDKTKANIYSDFNPLKAKDIADIIDFIISCPPHVTIQDIVVAGTQQASATLIDRSGRRFD